MISSFKFEGLYGILYPFSRLQNGDGAILILIDGRLSVFHGFRRKNFRGWRPNGSYKEGSLDVRRFSTDVGTTRAMKYLWEGERRGGAEISGRDEKNTFRIDSICQRAANCVIMPLLCAPKRLDHQ